MRIFLILVLLYPSKFFCQFKSEFKNGVYKAYSDLQNNSPAYNWNISTSKYFRKDTIEKYGIHYKIDFPGKDLKRKFLRDSIYCIVKDNEIFFCNNRYDSKINLPNITALLPICIQVVQTAQQLLVVF